MPKLGVLKKLLGWALTLANALPELMIPEPDCDAEGSMGAPQESGPKEVGSEGSETWLEGSEGIAKDCKLSLIIG